MALHAKGWSLEAPLLNATDERIEPVRDYQAPGPAGLAGSALRRTGSVKRIAVALVAAVRRRHAAAAVSVVDDRGPPSPGHAAAAHRDACRRR